LGEVTSREGQKRGEGGLVRRMGIPDYVQKSVVDSGRRGRNMNRGERERKVCVEGAVIDEV